jgi:hypothetical protein
MSNERITENIVREHLKKCPNIIFEEQQSNNDRVKKLLKNASKGGNSDGRPDFIIQYENNSNLIIVIECKSDTNKHEGNTQDNYKDYAVDGVKLYASFLAKEYDVIAIAVSGTEPDNLKISHFLQLKGTQKAEPIFANKLLTTADYLDGYIKDEKKFHQDFMALLTYSKVLNDKLYALKIPESNRSLLIAGTLIALRDNAFRNSYKTETNIDNLIDSFLTKVKSQLTDVGNENIDVILSTYSFLKTTFDDILILKNLITEIDDKINSFIKNYKYYDTLGQFYIEFLRKANNDSKLGIVLTPPHITDLFCELAQINKDSVVLDNCTGTGGFLISAMRKMIKDANGDANKEQEIKSKQIIGIEFQSHIFTILSSNMLMHGDGRSNLLKGSCFELKKEIEKRIIENKFYKPNVGFLNPPYKKNGSDDNEELEFILNNLSFLEKGSYCIAIVPMSCALATKGKALSLKQSILQQHSLDAVLSMPNELFKDSKVGVNTCIMIFKAKEPHPQNKEIWFAYCKDDGFTNRKTQGRFDYDKKWENYIKKYWVDNFINRKIIAGFSITKEIKANEEWCAEAYIETDCGVLEDYSYFNNTIMKHLSFELLNKHKTDITSDSYSSDKIDLDFNNWKQFRYENIFEIDRGKANNEDDTYNPTPLIGASQNENGSNGEYINAAPYYTNTLITVGNGGNTGCGQTFFQSIPFNAKSTVNVLDIHKRWNYKLNEFVGMFLTTIIKLEKYRFNFGRGWSKERMENDIIKLPVNEKGEPDFEFMENFIKSLPYSKNLE